MFISLAVFMGVCVMCVCVCHCSFLYTGAFDLHSFLLLCKPLHFYPFGLLYQFYSSTAYKRQIVQNVRYIVSVFPKIQINAINLSLDFFFFKLIRFIFGPHDITGVRFGERWSVPISPHFLRNVLILKSSKLLKSLIEFYQSLFEYYFYLKMY